MDLIERKIRNRRLKNLLEVFAENPGLSNDEANKVLLEKKKEEEEKLARGRESEKNVRVALRKLSQPSFITNIENIKHGSKRDLNGLDMRVFLNKEMLRGKYGSDSNVPYVWLQIKSSQAGAILFKQRYEGEDEELKEVEMELLRNKLIVLVGQDSAEEIQEAFIQGLGDIWEYHRR